MSYTVLARKYRPQRFADVIGQEHVTRTLKNAIEQGRIAHGYIFSGHRGIGKTTIARILAKALNCRSAEHPVSEPCGQCDSCTEIRAGSSVDVIEIDAATNRGIDEIRELREAARYRPARDRYKIYILDEAHQITDAAFNALLKTLEEPPGHVVFMMATTQPEDIPQTIRSRCQHFSFHAVKFDDIVSQLRSIAEQEEIEVDEDAIAFLAEAGDGSMRDALSIMDQAIACCAGRLTADLVRGLVGTVSSDILERIMQAVQRDSSEEVLRVIDKLMVEGQSPTHFARQMVRFLRNSLVAKVAGRDSQLLQISSDERARVAGVAELFSEEDLSRFLQIMLRTHSELGYKHEQRFHLELGVLKLVHAQRLLPIEQLLSGAAPEPKPTPPSSPPRVSAPVSTGGALSSTPAVPRRTGPSPFESDAARKTPRSETPSSPAMGSNIPRGDLSSAATAVAPAVITPPAPAPAAEPVTGDALQDSILSALEESGPRSVFSLIETGEWRFGDGEIVIQVPKGATYIEMSLGAEGQKILDSLATRLAGKRMRVRVVTGGSASPSAPARPRATTGSGARGRAMQDPIVRKMQEKFGAEIRTVIDLTEN